MKSEVQKLQEFMSPEAELWKTCVVFGRKNVPLGSLKINSLHFTKSKMRPLKDFKGTVYFYHVTCLAETIM